MFSLGSLVVQVQSDQEKQLFAFENCKTLPRFEDQFPRLPVFTGCSKLPLPMRSFQSYLQTRWFAVFPSQLKQLKRRKLEPPWVSWKSTQCSSTFIDRNTLKVKICSGRSSLSKSKQFLVSNCLTCLSFTKFFFLATFFFDRHARPCVRRVVVENRAFAIVFKATAARRAVSALQMAFQNRSKNNARLRREGSSLASEFVHACSWRYPATR